MSKTRRPTSQAAENVVSGRDDGLTVNQALYDYFKEHVALKCAAPERQEYAIRNLEAFFGNKSISAIDVPASRLYAEARRAVAKDSTIRRELGVLSAAANHARKWKRIVEMPSIELPEVAVLDEDAEAPYYTYEEVHELLIPSAEGELKQFIELAYWTGARRRSIENLTRGQVRWEAKRIHLRQPGKKVTKKRQPIVPILPPMESALEMLWLTGRDRLFCTRDFYRSYRRLCADMGMEGRSNPHMLRHSRATHLLQGGTGIYHVAKLLGDTIGTVERVYGHHAPDILAEALTSDT